MPPLFLSARPWNRPPDRRSRLTCDIGKQVKRKVQPKEEIVIAPVEVAVVPEEVPNPAVKIYIVQDRPINLVPCVVCGAETNSEAEEKLCWVCRRLKISAWRDSELVPAQE